MVQIPAIGLKCCVCGCGHGIWCRLQPWGCVCGCGHRIWCRLQPLGWSGVCVAVVTGYGSDSSHGAVCVAVVTGYGADPSHGTVCCVCGCGHRIWFRLQPWGCVLCVWLWSQDMVQTPAMGLCAVCVAVVIGYGSDSSHGAVCVTVVTGYGLDSSHGAEVLCVWLWSQDMV